MVEAVEVALQLVGLHRVAFHLGLQQDAATADNFSVGDTWGSVGRLILKPHQLKLRLFHQRPQEPFNAPEG